MNQLHVMTHVTPNVMTMYSLKFSKKMILFCFDVLNIVQRIGGGAVLVEKGN